MMSCVFVNGSRFAVGGIVGGVRWGELVVEEDGCMCLGWAFDAELPS